MTNGGDDNLGNHAEPRTAETDSVVVETRKIPRVEIAPAGHDEQSLSSTQDLPRVILPKKNWMGLHTSFEKGASLVVAFSVLGIFGATLFGAFVVIWKFSACEDATFANISEVLKFLINAVLPLVTLAVGYYLGDRNSSAKVDDE